MLAINDHACVYLLPAHTQCYMSSNTNDMYNIKNMICILLLLCNIIILWCVILYSYMWLLMSQWKLLITKCVYLQSWMDWQCMQWRYFKIMTTCVHLLLAYACTQCYVYMSSNTANYMICVILNLYDMIILNNVIYRTWYIIKLCVILHALSVR